MSDYPTITTAAAIAWHHVSETPDVKPNNAREYLVWRRFERKPGGYVTTADYLNRLEFSECEDDEVVDENGAATGWFKCGPQDGYDEICVPMGRIEWWAEMPAGPAAPGGE